MPSIRSCIASLAIMAMAFSPIAAAASSKTGSLVARNVNHVARSQVKASAALARRAANKKQQKRARAARVVKGAAAGSAAPATSSADPYAADSKFLNTKAALAARAVRCNGPNGDARCERAVGSTAPANANAVCIAGRCTFRCGSGFAPGGSDGTQCVQSAQTCGTTTCPTVTDGFNTCSGAGQCTPGCFDNNVPLQNSGSGALFCPDYNSNPAFCGTGPSSFQSCPAPYSGEGVASCNRGRCGLACVAGTAPRRSSTGVLYCY